MKEVVNCLVSKEIEDLKMYLRILECKHNATSICFSFINNKNFSIVEAKTILKTIILLKNGKL